jgi:hypothetical protein
VTVAAVETTPMTAQQYEQAVTALAALIARRAATAAAAGGLPGPDSLIPVYRIPQQPPAAGAGSPESGTSTATATVRAITNLVELRGLEPLAFWMQTRFFACFYVAGRGLTGRLPAEIVADCR